MSAADGSAEQKRALQVRVDHVLPGRILHPEHQPVLRDPRIIDQDMNLLEFRLNLLNDPRDIGSVGDATRKPLGGASGGSNRFEGHLEPLQAPGNTRDLRSTGRQADGDGAADTPGSAGHEGVLAVQIDRATGFRRVSLGHVRRILCSERRITRPRRRFSGVIPALSGCDRDSINPNSRTVPT